MSFRAFFQSYVDAALWSSSDEDGTPLDELGAELEADATARMEADCRDFFDACEPLWAEADGYSDEQAGHDFWLTRNRHGAGFWDRGLGDLGRKLTDMAHPYGSADLYVTDAGTIAHY
jgi:hypothetical protein